MFIKNYTDNNKSSTTMVDCTGYKWPWWLMICSVMNIFRFCSTNNVEWNLVISWFFIFYPYLCCFFLLITIVLPLHYNIDTIKMTIKSKRWQAMIIIAMICWMIIVQQNIAMIIMPVIPFLDKFINKMIRLSFQMANISFFSMKQVKITWLTDT